MAQRTASDSPTKFCTEEGCGRPLRARGLCSKHYNAKHQGRKFVDVECPTCGTITNKQENGASTRKFCSLACRDAWRSCQPDDPMWKLTRRQRVCKLPRDHPVMWVGHIDLLIYGECGECGAPTCSPARSPRRYCGTDCKRRAKWRRQGLVRAGRASPNHARWIPQLRRLAIFERDDWTCWLCGGETSKVFDSADPLSPTLDHLTPKSHGGGDGPDNLACAHYRCNSRRGASDTLTFISPAA